jgi:DNA-directed RNA polymerase beta' subunit
MENLNNDRIINFINKNIKYKEILIELFKNTKCIKKKDVIENIKNKLKLWKNQRENIKLYINLIGKIGSEHWIYDEIKYLLPQHDIILDENKLLCDNSEILYIDDWSLSGCNCCGILEGLLYKNTKLNKYKNIKYTTIFYISTKQSRDTLEDVIDYYKYINLNITYCIDIMRFDDIIKNNKIKFDSQLLRNFHIKFSPDTEFYSYPIVSDYKIPNQFASYPLIYENIFEIDRLFMEDVYKKWHKS